MSRLSEIAKEANKINEIEKEKDKEAVISRYEKFCAYIRYRSYKLHCLVSAHAGYGSLAYKYNTYKYSESDRLQSPKEMRKLRYMRDELFAKDGSGIEFKIWVQYNAISELSFVWNEDLDTNLW